MKWNLFLAAVVLAALFLFSAGAPPLAILLGVALAGAWNWWKRQKDSSSTPARPTHRDPPR